MDAQHEGRAAAVAELRPLDVPPAERRAGASHRHPVAVPQQQRPRSPCDGEDDLGLPGGPAAVLDLRHP
jgi:hypothetical protein